MSDGKLAIWVPFAREHGHGHFYRNLGIYEQIPSFYFSELKNPSAPKSVELFSCEDSPENILKFLRSKSATALLIDHYFLTQSTLDFFAKQKLIKTFYFDANFEALPFDFLINTNIFASTKSYTKSLPVGTNAILGADYYTFRTEIHQFRGAQKNDSIFICMGGTDPNEATLKILPFLDSNNEYQIMIGSGAGKAYFEKVKAQSDALNLKAQCHFDSPDFFRYLAQARYAILSASSIATEAIYLQTPFLCMETVNNQTKLSDYFRERKITVLSLGGLNFLKDELFKWPSLSSEMGNRAPELIQKIHSLL